VEAVTDFARTAAHDTAEQIAAALAESAERITDDRRLLATTRNLAAPDRARRLTDLHAVLTSTELLHTQATDLAAKL
jgi:hypothetical protein